MLAATNPSRSEALGHETEAMLKRALHLPDDQRAQLAAELFESLEGPAETTTDDDRLADIEARAERVRQGESQSE